MIFGFLALAVYSYFQDFEYWGVLMFVAVPSMMFLADTPAVPDETWSPQEKGAWTRRYTTLKLKDEKLIYVLSDKPKDVDTFELNKLNNLEYKKGKIILNFLQNAKSRKISTKYWNEEEVKRFIDNINKVLS